jgi:hypothetical protein
MGRVQATAWWRLNRCGEWESKTSRVTPEFRIRKAEFGMEKLSPNHLPPSGKKGKKNE